MLKRGRKRVERLGLIVNCLPYETRVAMLDGLQRYEIVAGAYSTREGGVCPMLAAHRCGGRTDFRAFAQAWDRFTGATKRARRATERELRTLGTQLQASVWKEETARADAIRLEPVEPGFAAVQERSAEPNVEGGPAKSAPASAGEAWLLPFRDWESYVSALERALAEFEGDRPAPPSSRDAAEVGAVAAALYH